MPPKVLLLEMSEDHWRQPKIDRVAQKGAWIEVFVQR